MNKEEISLYGGTIQKIENQFDKNKYILKLIYENFGVEYPENIDASVLNKNAQNTSEAMVLTLERADINNIVKEQSQKLYYYFQEKDIPVKSKIDFDASNDLLKLIETDIKNEKIREEVKKNMEEISKKYSDLIKRIELSKENENE